MKVDYIFATILGRDMLDLDNLELEKFCKKIIADDVEQHSLPAHKQRQSLFLDLDSPVLQPLLEQVTDRFNRVYQQMGLRQNTRIKILRAWANTNNTYAIDVPHTHPISFLTGIYYVKGLGMGDHGNINLTSPVMQLPHCIDKENVETHNPFNSWEWEAPPTTGNLIIFPSWILHNVSRNYLNEDRISIAFDGAIVED